MRVGEGGQGARRLCMRAFNAKLSTERTKIYVDGSIHRRGWMRARFKRIGYRKGSGRQPAFCDNYEHSRLNMFRYG